MNTAGSRRSHVWLAWLPGLLVTLVVIGASGAFYLWYSASDSHDVSPDSLVGLAFAVAGTLCVLLAAFLYAARRRSRKRTVGQLNTSLHWHIYLALTGLALLLMHSFGNFNARTGTYALYGLVAVVVSGLLGRLIDRYIPRLIAIEVAKTLTEQGEDRVEVLSRRLQSLAGLRRRPEAPTLHPIYAHRARPTNIPDVPWDIAYTSLEMKQLHDPRRQFVPSPTMTPFAPYPIEDFEAEIAGIQQVERAMTREEFYRTLIHYWRLLHIAIVLLTLALIAWHLVFAVQLMLKV